MRRILNYIRIACVLVITLCATCYAGSLEGLIKLANQGNEAANYDLCRIYLQGEFVAKSPQLAAAHCRQAALLGHPNAQTTLGILYEEGLGVTKNSKEGFLWLTKAAEQGHPPAQAMLSYRYLIGKGVIQDYVISHMWANLAASQGDHGGTLSLDVLSKKMNQAQIAEAQKMAREWKPKAR